MITSSLPSVDAKSYYTATETAKKLGICRNTLSKLRRQNAIKPNKDTFSGRFLYSGKEIQRFWLNRIN